MAQAFTFPHVMTAIANSGAPPFATAPPRRARYLRAWWAAGLRRKIMLAMLAAAALASLLLLLAFFAVYRSQLAQERSVASMQVNRLLEAALKNAMLKRDVPGLQEIVSSLGEQQGILAVRILNPAGVIRFASDPRLSGCPKSASPLAASDASPPAPLPRGKTGAPASAAACDKRLADERMALPGDLPAAGIAHFTGGDDGREVLRAIKPVFNEKPCAVCHGSLEQHPLNGVLVVDYDARTLRVQARDSAFGLTAGAALVMLLSCIVGYWALRRYVIAPVDTLAAAARRLSEGDHDARVPVRDDDELAQLGRTFNDMASNLAASVSQLQAQQDYLRRLLDSLPDAVRVISPGYRVLAVNEAYCKLLGLSRDAALDQACYRSNHARDEPCPPTLVTCPLHVLSDAQPVLKYEQRLQRADGGEVAVETVAARILLAGPQGEQACVVESLRDLSTLARYSQEQRLSEIGMLAAGIAHEIHNPLGSVRLAVQSLTRSADSAVLTKDDVQEGLALVDGEIDRCIEVTRRLLLLCRHPDEALQCVDVNHAMHDAVMLLGYEALAGGIEQIEDYAAESPLVCADPGELRMMIFNMVQNAHHAMPHGGEVRLRSRIEGEMALIEIADNGVGIAPENLLRVFQPFYSQRADGEPGTGLGLSIVRSTVTRYGGQIEVDSAPGRGACFRIRLPRVDPGSAT
ncbi:MAG: HAMP domain-containing protein [Azonexus sp.]|nr:HAMP domain-containing protein [Azonexus sp.]